MTRYAALLCATVVWTMLAPATGQISRDYPNHPIHVVVPSPSGGSPDLIIRLLAPKLAIALGQPPVIDNRAGAGIEPNLGGRSLELNSLPSSL
jgi:tripartite-type tricarboxylate transporter receptor subunit TctC